MKMGLGMGEETIYRSSIQRFNFSVNSDPHPHLQMKGYLLSFVVKCNILPGCSSAPGVRHKPVT